MDEEPSIEIVVQTAKYDGLGRRVSKTVTKSGDLDGTFRFYYDGQRIAEITDGGDQMLQQIIHGTRYIDEILMVRIAGKGDYYVYQDQNYNVTALVDQGGADIEKYDYTPYGELTVSQVSGPGDYDGDGDVDATDRAAAESMGACRGANPEGACRILDLDFDGDTDDDDLTLFDLLEQDDMREPDLPYSRIGFRFGHQGLYYDAEIESYQNRARQYLPKLKRFAQRDPLGYVDGENVYLARSGNPITVTDPAGLCGLIDRILGRYPKPPRIVTPNHAMAPPGGASIARVGDVNPRIHQNNICGRVRCKCSTYEAGLRDIETSVIMERADALVLPGGIRVNYWAGQVRTLLYGCSSPIFVNKEYCQCCDLPLSADSCGQVITHECTHLCQCQKHGSMGFNVRYGLSFLLNILNDPTHNLPFEAEAYASGRTGRVQWEWIDAPICPIQ